MSQVYNVTNLCKRRSRAPVPVLAGTALIRQPAISLDADVIYQDGAANYVINMANTAPETTTTGAEIPNGTTTYTRFYTGSLKPDAKDDSLVPDYASGKPNLQAIWLEGTLAQARQGHQHAERRRRDRGDRVLQERCRLGRGRALVRWLSAMPRRPAVDAVSMEKITESLDLIAQGRKGCPLLQVSGFVPDQLLFPVAQRRRVLEVLGVDGALLIAAELGDLLVELGQVWSGTYALFQHRQAPFQRVEAAAKLRQQLALPPASAAAGSGLFLDPPGRHQLDHLLTDPARVNAQAVQYPYGDTVVRAEQAEQDVLGPDVGMTERDGLAQ